MKKILLGLTFLTSISSFASFSGDVRSLGVVTSFKVHTFKSCLELSIITPQFRDECLKDIPELLEAGLTAEEISNIAIAVREEESTRVREAQERDEQIRQIENSINRILD
jgi:hypothetical protein